MLYLQIHGLFQYRNLPHQTIVQKPNWDIKKTKRWAGKKTGAKQYDEQEERKQNYEFV